MPHWSANEPLPPGFVVTKTGEIRPQAEFHAYNYGRVEHGCRVPSPDAVTDATQLQTSAVLVITSEWPQTATVR